MARAKPSGDSAEHDVPLTLYDSRNGDLSLEVSDLGTSAVSQPHRSNFFSIYWVKSGRGSYWAGESSHSFAAPCLLFFTPYQAIRLAPDSELAEAGLAHHEILRGLGVRANHSQNSSVSGRPSSIK